MSDATKNKILAALFISFFSVIVFFIVIFFFSGSEPCYGCGLAVPFIFLVGPVIVVAASFLHRFQIFKKYSFYSFLATVIAVILIGWSLIIYFEKPIDYLVCRLAGNTWNDFYGKGGYCSEAVG